MEDLVERIGEIILEVYMRLTSRVFPEKRGNKTSKTRKAGKAIAVTATVVVFLGIITLLIWGICLIVAEKTLSGVFLTFLSVFIFTLHIVVGLIIEKEDQTDTREYPTIDEIMRDNGKRVREIDTTENGFSETQETELTGAARKEQIADRNAYGETIIWEMPAEAVKQDKTESNNAENPIE